MTRCTDWYFWCKFNLFFYWAGRERLRQKRFWTSWRICRASRRRLMLWWQTSLPACPIFRCPLPVIQVCWIVLDQSSMVKSMIQFIVASRCFVCGSIHLDYKMTICQKKLFDSWTSSLPGGGSFKSITQRLGQLFGRQSQSCHRPRPEGGNAMRCDVMLCRMAFFHSAVLGFVVGTW